MQNRKKLAAIEYPCPCKSEFEVDVWIETDCETAKTISLVLTINSVIILRQGDYFDLCINPPKMPFIDFFKISSVYYFPKIGTYTYMLEDWSFAKNDVIAFNKSVKLLKRAGWIVP